MKPLEPKGLWPQFAAERLRRFAGSVCIAFPSSPFRQSFISAALFAEWRIRPIRIGLYRRRVSFELP